MANENLTAYAHALIGANGFFDGQRVARFINPDVTEVLNGLRMFKWQEQPANRKTRQVPASDACWPGIDDVGMVIRVNVE